MPKRGQFAGRCTLCGAQTAGDYCYAHAWAGNRNNTNGELEQARVYRDGFRDGYQRGSLPSRPAGSSELVGSRSKSRRPHLSLESKVATNHLDRSE